MPAVKDTATSPPTEDVPSTSRMDVSEAASSSLEAKTGKKLGDYSASSRI